MAKPVRAVRPTPNDGRQHRGLKIEEFTPYSDTDGRVDPMQCNHPIFLDHNFGVTVICLECGSEVSVTTWKVVQPNQVLTNGSSIEYVAEGVRLTDSELDFMRTRWHAIWALDGWTHPAPDLASAKPPARLAAQFPSGPPAARTDRGSTRARSPR